LLMCLAEPFAGLGRNRLLRDEKCAHADPA
jgi:hypothetical protein